MIRFQEKNWNAFNFSKLNALIMSLFFLALFTNSNMYGQKSNSVKARATKATVVEIVLMKVKTGITDNEFLLATKSIDKVASNFSGFISRELAKDKNGNWIDIVHWTNLKSAQKAEEEEMKSSTCNVFFGMIDQKSMKLYQFDSVHRFNKK